MGKINLTLFFLAAPTICALATHTAIAAPLELLGVKAGSIHRMAVGSGEITARVVGTGTEGWVLFSVMSDDSRWQRGTRLWINLDRIDNLSAPAASAPIGSASAIAPISEAELASLPCFSQVEVKDAQAVAKSQSFDRNQFLTECILRQRKKP